MLPVLLGGLELLRSGESWNRKAAILRSGDQSENPDIPHMFTVSECTTQLLLSEKDKFTMYLLVGIKLAELNLVHLLLLCHTCAAMCSYQSSVFFYHIVF